MDNLNLKRFQQDAELRDAVLAYFIDYFEKRAMEKLFAREDVSAFPEAFDVIKEAIENLDVIFNPAPKKVEIDEAR